MNNKKATTDLINQYLEKYKGMGFKTIARKVYKDHPTVFISFDQCYSKLRYHTGTMGRINRKRRQIEKAPPRDKAIQNRWSIPKSKAKGRRIYQIPAQYDRVLWISDIHFPNHDVLALSTALDYGLDKDANCIIIGGDLLDNAPFTRFQVPPSAKFAREIFDQTVEFLAALRMNFPKAHILYMQGNHDRWYEDWLMSKCAEVFDDPHYQLEARLQLDRFNISYHKENVIVKAGKLPMLHGHTIVRGVFAPVNSARGAYTKSNHNLLIGHTHQVSVHSAKDLMGRPTKTWSTGCLCTLNPDYDPHNIRHTHGFAYITTEKNGNFIVNNFEIVDGQIR